MPDLQNAKFDPSTILSNPNVSNPPMAVSPNQLDINNLMQEITGRQAEGVPSIHTPTTPAPVISPTEPQSAPTEPQSAPTPTTPEPESAPTGAPEPAEEGIEGLLNTTLAKKGPADSIKALRQKSNELKQQLEAKEEQILEREERLQRYEKGEILSDTVKSKLERVSQLEQYEKLHALKTTPEFQETYVQPIEELKQKAQSIAEDYKLPIGVIEKAYHIHNQKERNAYLMSHFDTIGATEVTELISDMKEAINDKERAELEPQEALRAILETKQQNESVSNAQRLAAVERNANSGWTDSLVELTTSGEYPELTYTGDPEHDNKYVKPVLEEAAKEFGRFVKSLAALGARDLPPELAKIVAKRFQLSQASAVMAASRAHHYTRAEEVISSARRTAPLLRPQIGGGVASSPSSFQRNGSGGLEAAADALLKKVGVA